MLNLHRLDFHHLHLAGLAGAQEGIVKIEMRDGRRFEGTPVQIVQAMKSIAFGVDRLGLSEYIDWVAAQALKFEGVELDVTGKDEETKSDALVHAMLDAGLAVKA